ncbi:aminotransferase class V-fold PLP-dependent enzyme [Flavobacterium sp. Sd200]|uniref:cysteine desulfurase family protein n=1 Tax=Flavobacterium sp. Sd200 TaxID=2692211 RepID=UPI00136AB894|nr:cysteine desulfurase family protein [Flavobacterium sp. Sd200]MXN93153.1 aminotransferase class V-fold PLP-dependent enzyme [Flavobacterium sp. Sd200]
MKKAYLDNASTTAMHPLVIEEMVQVMGSVYGNPSSTHSTGRQAKVVLETARKTIAFLINAEAREIIFTSGGTEANNLVLHSAVKDLGIRRIISSRTEHHSVLNTIPQLAAQYGIDAVYVNLLPGGQPDMEHLEALLQQDIPTLVSLIHVNNETGVVLNLNETGSLCRKYKALFHTDTVQSVGKTEFDLQNLPVDFIVASAHKFHGPKGIGFLYIDKTVGLKPMVFGGEQEKGLRPGTEPIHQIAGMAKALQLSYAGLQEHRQHISGLKDYLHSQLELHFPGFKVNGKAEGEALFYNITNILLPLPEDKTAMILFSLDMQGVEVSRGSACQSGSVKPSHVLKEILSGDEVKKPSLRISFSHYNTTEDIDQLIVALKKI